MNAFGINSETAFKYARRAIVGVFAVIALLSLLFVFKACRTDNKPQIENTIKEKAK